MRSPIDILNTKAITIRTNISSHKNFPEFTKFVSAFHTSGTDHVHEGMWVWASNGKYVFCSQ